MTLQINDFFRKSLESLQKSFLPEAPLSSPIDLLALQLADAPLTPRQHAVWRDLCAEIVLARVRIQELENRLKVLEHQPGPDITLHAVLTRPEFNREVARMLAFDERYGGISSVLYFDVENLDSLEARHGRALINTTLRCISDTLIANIRQSDILGRLATEEFGVLLPRCDNADAWKKGEQIASAIYDSLAKVWGPTAQPSVTYGAYTFREKENLATGLKNAAGNVTKLVKR